MKEIPSCGFYWDPPISDEARKELTAELMPVRYLNRETWLYAAMRLIEPVFTEKGYTYPKMRASVGFSYRGFRRGGAGQCWSSRSSIDGVNEIFVCPSITCPHQIFEILIHEIGHAIDDCVHAHQKPWQVIMRNVGMNVKRNHTWPTQEMKIKITQWVQKMPRYPHGGMILS